MTRSIHHASESVYTICSSQLPIQKSYHELRPLVDRFRFLKIKTPVHEPALWSLRCLIWGSSLFGNSEPCVQPSQCSCLCGSIQHYRQCTQQPPAAQGVRAIYSSACAKSWIHQLPRWSSIPRDKKSDLLWASYVWRNSVEREVLISCPSRKYAISVFCVLGSAR